MLDVKLFLLATAILAFSCCCSQADDPTGRWKGSWISGKNGHKGPMRARITPTASGTYQAVFAGRFALVVPFVYRAEMRPVETWNGTTYVVEKRLGMLGSYKMDALVNGGKMHANWSAVGDSGQVQMSRLGNN
jgi:hypothetical protein